MESQMQQHGSTYFACRPPPPLTLGDGSRVKIQLLRNMVMSHIKLNVRPWGWGQNSTWSEQFML